MKYLFQFYQFIITLLPFYITYLVMRNYYPPTSITNWIIFILAIIFQTIVYKYLINVISGFIIAKFFYTSSLIYGNVGTTARTIGSKYLFLKKNSEKTDKEIINEMVRERYKFTRNKSLLSLIDNTESLTTLVLGILSFEAGLQENSMQFQLDCAVIIQKELEKLGVEESIL